MLLRKEETRGGEYMHKLTRLFILTTLSVISASSIYANYSTMAYGTNPNYPQSQMSYDSNPYNQNTPNTSGEHSFMMQSRNRFNQMNQANRNMIQQDRSMMREGYDPNENYYSSDARSFQQQYDPNNPYRNQEQMMRGNYDAGTPQNYPLENNYPNASRHYPQRGYQSSMRGYNQNYNTPPGGYSYNYNRYPSSDYSYQEMSNAYELGYNDSKAQPESYPLNENYPNTPQGNNQQQRQSNDNKQGKDNKFTSYPYPSSPYYSEYQYIGDNTDDVTSPSSNRGKSTDMNMDRNRMDDQTYDKSSSNTTSSSTRQGVRRY